MSLDELYAFAEEQGIEIHNFDLDMVKTLSVPDHIAVNYRKLSGIREEKALLFHEVGHCATGCFYTGKSPLDLKGRHEFRAQKWAFTKQIPIEELKWAVRQGYKEAWELADYFEVEESVIIQAVTYYRENGLI